MFTPYAVAIRCCKVSRVAFFFAALSAYRSMYSVLEINKELVNGEEVKRFLLAAACSVAR